MSQGCGKLPGLPGFSSSWHTKYNWQAEDYFDDPQVIALCDAIEANDLPEMDRLIAAGADVNAIGKDNMTPLLWAFPDNKLDRFTKLLEAGADPNVVVTSYFDSKGIMPDDSVMTLAAGTNFEGYLKAVLKHGGDPNLEGRLGRLPLHCVMTSGPNPEERIKMLLKAGADINGVGEAGDPPIIRAAGYGNFPLAIFLLEQGADPRVRDAHLSNIADTLVIREMNNSKRWPPSVRADFFRLEQWLLDHNISVKNARADFTRWKAWSKSHTYKHYTETLWYKELSARLAKELAAKEKAAAANSPTDNNE